ncbi:ATP-binding cassette domain-containing protein [Candidatus Woesearchaeota archaeon]|nr:ATP-binding cassette domain-containing protein [Candidatus Woesearchaeota archaeon]
MDIIRVKDLKKHFRTFKKEAGVFSTFKSLFKRDYVTVKALDGIEFSVKKGEIRGFIGPNGAGKSTTIKILSGILHHSEGEVLVNNFQPWKEREKYVQRIGVVFGQKPQLWLDLPALDTFQLNKTLYEIPESKFRKNLNYFIELFDLKEVVRRPVRQLSLGEKMKCELISSLLHDPDVVFLDEPTIGLDLISKERIREFIKKVNKDKGITFLLTTHDLDDIENLCEKVLIINKGKIVYDGRLAELKKEVLKTKLIEVTFKEPVRSYGKVPKGINVVSKNHYEVKMEVDKSQHEVQRVINYIIKHYPVQDLNVSNPGIEEVIKKIYEKE